MNRKAISLAFMLAGIELASAGPVRCVVHGKTIYTDDPSRCANADVKAVGGNVSVFPKVTPSAKVAVSPMPMTTPAAAPVSESLLERLGLSGEDLANGWKTIMEAKQRGSWKAPDVPDEAK